MDPPSSPVGAPQGGPFRPGEAPEKKVRVAVRIRPLLPQDGPGEDACLAEAAGSDVPSCCVTVLDEHGAGATAAQYRVDSCWGAGASGRAIFEWEVAPLVRASFCCGHPATLFTHGASGSGKSHTMQGTAGDPGVAPLAVEQLLRLAAAGEGPSGLRVSFMEIYLDRCHDLLLPGAELPLLEDARGRVHLPGLTQVPVACAADFAALWVAGCAARHTAATGVNAASSRSHSVLTLTPEAPHAGQVTLIDLAGFEDNKRTGNEGQRMRESARINSSLFALHKVLVGLTSGQPHVAYRDSKLTRLLRSSLAGPGRALLLLCLAPGRSHASAAHASLALAGLTGQLRLPPPAAPSCPPPRLPQQPAAPSSFGRAAERLAALQAWQEAKGRTPRPPAALQRRTRTAHATSPPSAAPPEGAPVPADAAARLAHVEALLAHRCQAMLTAQQQGTPLRPDGAGVTAREVHLEFGQTGKENVPPATPPRSPAACSPAGPCGGRTPLQQLRQAQTAASRALEAECLAVLNAGDRPQLLALRGIGARRADAVLALRQAAGGGPVFHCKDDLAAIGLRGKQARDGTRGGTICRHGLVGQPSGELDVLWGTASRRACQQGTLRPNERRWFGPSWSW